MAEKDEFEEQKKPANAKLPYIMVLVLVVLVLSLISSISNTISDFVKKQNGVFQNSPRKAFNSKSIKNSDNIFSDIGTKDYQNNMVKSSENVINLPINEPMCFNGMTKKEVYEIRKSFVKKSIFNRNDYEPNEEVFGSIVDGKDWWGLEPLVCSRKGESTTYGVSAVSRFINNPDLLVQTYFPFSLSYSERLREYCDGNFSRNIPIELTYNDSKKMITAKYEMSPFIYKNKVNYFNQKNIHYPLILSGLNARDFGYEYMYITDLQNITMLNEENASKKVHKFADFIHVGSSCRAPGGCNNMSPRQTELEFNVNGLPAEMMVKLWKRKPLLPNFPADMYFKIEFEKVQG